MGKTNILYKSGHPDIPLPESQLVEIGTPFTAAVPQTVSGWTFEGWYTDRNYTNKWVDGTIVTGDLDLFGKWSEGGGGGDDIVNFAYTRNSEDLSAPLPNGFDWPTNTMIYPKDLPSLPTPTASTTTITGWYVDEQGQVLIDEDGILVGDGGISLYAKAESSEIHSVSFDYAVGRIDPNSNEDYPMPASSTAAWDAETLDDDNVLPTDLITGAVGETVELPLAEAMQALFAETDCEATFKGWYTDPVASGTPVTSVTLGEDDTTVYALYEPKTEPEFIDVTYKVATVYVPAIDSSGAVVPSSEMIAVSDAISLMPNVPCEYVGAQKEVRSDVQIEEYEWHDKVLKGNSYTLARPNSTTERTGDYEFGGYYSDINCETPMESVIENITENLTVYCKFVPKAEVVLPAEELPKTYNITFEVDGFAADTDVPSGGLMPPDLELPDATIHQPVDIDKEAFPDLIDAYIPPEMPACEGFTFKNWYFYDENGDKVEFVPGETEITRDMVLHPEFEMVNVDTTTTVQLVEMTPETLGAPEDLDWDSVPNMPFAGIQNPITVNIGLPFSTTTIELPELEPTFEVAGYYIREQSGDTYTMRKFTSGIINSATTLYVQFASTIDKPIDVIYEIEETGEEAELLAPDFDYELAAATASTDGFEYEPRPADLVAAATGTASTDLCITGYYTDASYATKFDPQTVTQAGDTVTIYPKMETQTDKIMVTVDYIPRVYTATATDFQFEIPTAPELPMASNSTTYLLSTNATGATILSTIGQPPIVEFWRPKVHEYGNCYWYTKASDTAQSPSPFNPADFTLTEPIILYPQFEADMNYPQIKRRDDLNLTLTQAVKDSAAAGASSN